MTIIIKIERGHVALHAPAEALSPKQAAQRLGVLRWLVGAFEKKIRANETPVQSVIRVMTLDQKNAAAPATARGQ